MVPDRCDVKSNGGRCKGADLGHWDILTVYRTPPAKRSHSVSDTTCKGTHLFPGDEGCRPLPQRRWCLAILRGHTQSHGRCTADHAHSFQDTGLTMTVRLMGRRVPVVQLIWTMSGKSISHLFSPSVNSVPFSLESSAASMRLASCILKSAHVGAPSVSPKRTCQQITHFEAVMGCDASSPSTHSPSSSAIAGGRCDTEEV